jgi:hypothetical protein
VKIYRRVHGGKRSLPPCFYHFLTPKTADNDILERDDIH